MPNLMRPYPRDSLNSQKRIFNYRLSRARRNVEATFGILARKWYVYRREFECKLETVDKIIKATCVLHNYLIDKQPSYLEDCATGNDTNEFADTNIEQEPLNIGINEGYNVREQFCAYFNTQGTVPWQGTRIGSLLNRNY